MDRSHRTRRTYLLLSLLVLVAGCASLWSLFTRIDPDDAGHHSFVRQVVPKLYGRKIRGQVETQVMVDVINGINRLTGRSGNEGRVELLGALMATPAFAEHWHGAIIDWLSVNRIGEKHQRMCYERPMRPSVDVDLADITQSVRADLAGFAGIAPDGFNMNDLLAAALKADTLFPVYSAHLFAIQSRPLIGNEATEQNKRADLAATLERAYLNRKLECLQCHNSSFSMSGQQTFWNRSHPVWGKFEKALFENEQGGDPARLHALLRTDISRGTVKPWGRDSGQGLDCGIFAATAPALDPVGAVPYLTRELPLGSSIWDVNRLLNEGRRTIANEGLVRSKPAACDICSQTECLSGVPSPPQQPQTDQIHTLFRDKGCFGCHGGTSPLGGLDLAANAPTARWVGNLLEVPSQTDPTIRRVRRADPANSMLIRRLRGTQPGESRMPPGTPLSEAEIQQVEAWINGLPPPTAPLACNVCRTPDCTAIGSDVDGPAALAAVVGMTIGERLWEELVGTRLTIANYFPRTEEQRNVLYSLTEYSLLMNDWSLREPIKRVLASNYFNRKAPRTATPPQAYDEPLVRNPWAEIDPRFPPVALPGWTPASTAPPAVDPAYRASDHPPSHRNSMSDGIHRYSAQSLITSMHAALGWPAPPRFPLPNSAEEVFAKAIGQFMRDSEPGFRETDFQGLLAWEKRHVSCAKPPGTDPDWIDRLVDAVAAYNVANPSAPLTIRDVVLVMKDWFLSDARIGEAAMTLDDNRTERELLAAFFGADIASLHAQVGTVAERAALDGRLREFCGVLVQTPQFWLAGIAATDIGEPLKLRVCNGAPCTYLETCNAIESGFKAARAKYQLLCSDTSLQVIQRPDFDINEILVNLCLGGSCRYIGLPRDFLGCVTQHANPAACLPQQPPRCDIGCSRIDCCGGPHPPLGLDAKPRPSMILAWLEGETVGVTRGVRRLPAAERSAGYTGFSALEPGTRLAPGDILELDPKAQLEMRTRRGQFALPQGGIGGHPAGGAWYVMVSGPSVLRDAHGPAQTMRWRLSRPEIEFMADHAKRGRALNLEEPKRRRHDEAERLRARVESPPVNSDQAR